MNTPKEQMEHAFAEHFNSDFSSLLTAIFSENIESFTIDPQGNFTINLSSEMNKAMQSSNMLLNGTALFVPKTVQGSLKNMLLSFSNGSEIQLSKKVFFKNFIIKVNQFALKDNTLLISHDFGAPYSLSIQEFSDALS